MSTSFSSIESQILSRVILPEEPTVSAEAARSLLLLSFSETDRERMRRLSEKSRQGTVTSEDREWLDGYERIGSLIGLLQSKARISLKRSSAGQV